MTLEQYQDLTSEKQHRIGAMQGDLVNGFINSGQIAGLISSELSVAELIETMMRDAKESIKGALESFGAIDLKI